MQSINQNYPSIVEEIFEQARFRVGRTVRLRKEAIEFYQQKLHNSVNHSGDELIVEKPKRSSIVQDESIPKQTREELDSEKAPIATAVDQNPLNLRQIDELSESESDSSGDSTKNSRFLMKEEGSEHHQEEGKRPPESSLGPGKARGRSFKRNSSLRNTNLLKEIVSLRAQIAALEKTQVDIFTFLKENLAPPIGRRKSESFHNRI